MQAIDFIDLKAQQLRIYQDIDARMKKVLSHGQYIMGPEITELESCLAAYAGVKYCVAVSSGTDALLMALMALGVSSGDEVITSPFTFIATAEVIALLGAKPVFVDIDPRTYNIDPAKIEAAITSRTKAILPVSLYGQCADFDLINTIAAKYALTVIEDACQSFGATYKGRKSCGLSTIACTSFFPSKPLGCYGDGGACFTDDEELFEKLKVVRIHGQDRRYHHPVIGINGRMDTLQAAILLSKLAIFNDEVGSRESIGRRYTELIRSQVPGTGTPFVEAFNTCVYAQYTVQVDSRDEVQKRLADKGIPTAVHYPVPLHMQPVFSGLNHAEGDFPVSESLASKVISLPMHPYLQEDVQDRVVTSLASVVSGLQ